MKKDPDHAPHSPRWASLQYWPINSSPDDSENHFIGTIAAGIQLNFLMILENNDPKKSGEYDRDFRAILRNLPKYSDYWSRGFEISRGVEQERDISREILHRYSMIRVKLIGLVDSILEDLRNMADAEPLDFPAITLRTEQLAELSPRSAKDTREKILRSL